MGYVPEWARGTQAKTGQSTSQPKQGVRSVELFHNAPKPGSNAKQNPFNRHYADGGEVELNANGDKVGEYSGNDEIVKYRMNQIDAKGNDLRIPASAKTTQSQMEVQDMENGSGAVMNKVEKEIKAESPAAKPSTRVTPQSQYEYNDMENGPGEKTSADPELVRKAYIEAGNIQRRAKEKPLQNKADEAMFNMMKKKS